MKRILSVFLAVVLLIGGIIPVAGAADRDPLVDFAYKEWQVTKDFSEVIVGGKTYPLHSILYRERSGNYVFWHWWNDYLLNPRRQQDYTPGEWYEQQVIPKTRESVQRIAGYFPNEEIILINGRPWQETEWAEEYLSLLPENVRDLAMDTTLNGWLKEAAIQGVSAEQLRLIPRAEIPVRLTRYRMYRTPEEFVADGADFTEGSKAKESMRVPAGAFVRGKLEGDDSTDADSSESMFTHRRIRMVMFLDDPEAHVTNFVGTPFEHSGVLILDQPPKAPNGHTLIPVRAFAETFSIVVRWENETRTAILYNGDMEIRLPVGSKEVTIETFGPEGTVRTVAIAEPVRIENSRTLIPLRFVSETFGFDVGWNGELRRITIDGTVQLAE